ncbi:glycosyltransferase [uncultured Desulfuromonas sp.]|uniref:glycosyltransferase n=1 Tax=uncultured Desulfuromonas sp. TaxID=181013 RepID=UPI002AAC33F1|nr:glycosyltransferase [uncultured Desulfuromonas sp.]
MYENAVNNINAEEDIIMKWSDLSIDPLVSICCTTYNHESFIEDALKGFLIQKTSFPFEILIRDDASTDLTPEIVRKYESLYSTIIKVIYESENQYSKGVRPLKALMGIARGKYIAVCEGDDYWTDPLKLQKQIDFLEENDDYVVTFHDAIIVNNEGGLVSRSKLAEDQKRDYLANDLVTEGRLLTLTMCFRNVINDYPAEYDRVFNCDRFLMVLLGLHGKAKYMGDEIEPAVYRQHSGGIWSGMKNTEQQFQNLNTMIHIYTYLKRIEKNSLAVVFFENQVAPRVREIYFPESHMLSSLIKAKMKCIYCHGLNKIVKIYKSFM